MKKKIVIHYHIFKNAGTTIDYILEKNFGSKAFKLDPGEPRSIILPQELLKFLENHLDAMSISSHQLRFPIPLHQNFNFIPIIFFRHPIDRAFSIYSFYRRDSRNTKIINVAKQSTLKQFIQYVLDSDDPIMSNFQTRFLTKQNNFIDVDENDLNHGYEILKELKICGIVDRMDHSLVAYEHELEKYFPSVDLSYISQNVSENKYTSINERIEKGKMAIGDELIEKLIRANIFDSHLYYYVNKKLDAVINRIINFDNKLDHFKQRCMNLQTNWKFKNSMK